jgi:hypothetical protein
MMSLEELQKKLKEENDLKLKLEQQKAIAANAHMQQILDAPKNTVQMPQVQPKVNPAINPITVIPPKTGGCGCWGNKE